MNEKVQVINQKYAEFQQALSDLIGTEFPIRIHGWFGSYNIQNKLAESIMETLKENDVEFTDEVTSMEGYSEIKCKFECGFSLTANYKVDLETKKRRLEAQLAALEQEIAKEELSTTK